MKRSHGAHIVLVGCGNIGSHVVPHLARMGEVDSVTIVDRDVYEPRNLVGQDIMPADVGKPKAVVQARRLRRIKPGLRVQPVVDTVEHLPLGVLRSDVLLTGLDSRLARQIVNERASMLGVAWIDAGVRAEGSLARVTVYVPGDGRPCLECGFSEEDYEGREQTYPCSTSGNDPGAPDATNAPSSLGALAASLLSIECERLIDCRGDSDVGGFSILVEAAHHQYYMTRLAYNPNCRMPEHKPVPIVGEVPRDASLETLFEDVAHMRRGTPARDDDGGADGRVRVMGQSFATGLTCPTCGNRRGIFHLKVALEKGPAVSCEACGHAMRPTGFDTTDEFRRSTLSPEIATRSLGDIGIRPRDVLRVTSANGEVFQVEVRGNQGRQR
jgi:molybdopterin/thiamine biosynthesis adenylyltransferase/Zn ribbon nucleic-acid-binding protein